LHDASKENESVTLTGLAASETGFKQFSPGKRVLHLATHGFFLEGTCDSHPQTEETLENRQRGATVGNPLLLSGLAFAGANHRDDTGRDGIVTSEEIAVMDLSGVDLAVLSACDTGRGQIRAGEGVFGLRRAFQLAGANAVVMSLWPVDDEMTREWMLAMYHEWLVDGKSTAAAVRLANLKILSQQRAKHLSTHPFYWAAFISAGNRE
jgi:CHAT domain-containing protein